MSAAGLYAKKKAVGTILVNPDAQPVPLGFGVRVKAPNTNTGTVYVGGKTDATVADGYPLRANDDVPVWVQNLADIGLISDTAGQEVRILVEK